LAKDHYSLDNYTNLIASWTRCTSRLSTYF